QNAVFTSLALSSETGIRIWGAALIWMNCAWSLETSSASISIVSIDLAPFAERVLTALENPHADLLPVQNFAWFSATNQIVREWVANIGRIAIAIMAPID